MLASDVSIPRDDDLRLLDPNPCNWGSGVLNPRGLRMRFREIGPAAVEARYVIDEELAGWKGIAHGGVQAGMLDVAMSYAFRLYVEDDSDCAGVTTDLCVRYKGPVPTLIPLCVSAHVVGETGRDLLIEARIRRPGGDTLTFATATWRNVSKSRVA